MVYASSAVNLSIAGTLGTAETVRIKRSVLILGVVLYTSLCSWNLRQCHSILIKAVSRVVLTEEFHCSIEAGKRPGYVAVILSVNGLLCIIIM